MGLLTKEITRKNGMVVKIEDLSSSSRANVKCECDGCQKILTDIKWKDYKKCVKKDGKYYCSQCSKNGFKRWISFYEWCYKNLSKEESNKLMSRWDYNKNIDKNNKSISPKDISHGSNKLYWFKCPDNIEHISEQKNINTFTNGKQSKIDCHQCNSISATHPYLVKFLVNKDDALKYSAGSTKKVILKCIDCGYEKEKSIYDWVNKGFGCPKCSDGISYPEKFIFGLIEQLNIPFKTQLSKTTFNWCDNYRYDFYIEQLNGIIEVHGEQHYEEKDNKWGSLKQIQQNDILKVQLAINNNIDNYIVLDCSKSEMEWIKNSVICSDLPRLLSFREQDIDWLTCHEYGCNSLVKVICDLWNEGIKNIISISDRLNINSCSVRNYLKQGVKLGWSNYNPKESLTNKEYLHKKIICLNTNEIFNSILEASKIYNINKSSISACCRRVENKSAGKHPKTGEKMVWMFHDDYLIDDK